MTEAELRLKPLMLRGLDGESVAYAELLRVLGGYLRNHFARRLGSGAADVEDLVQETLLAIHVKRHTFDRSLPLTPWAYAIARYKLLDHLRKVGVRAHIPLDDAGDLFAAENPEEGAVRRDVDKLLATLPPRQRRLMNQVKIAGYSMEEAAAANGMSVSAVKVSVHRTMKSLSAKVADENR